MATTTTTTNVTHDPIDQQPPRLRAVLTCLVIGVFIASLDQTVIGTAIVRMTSDLGGYDRQAWVTTAYLVTAMTAGLVSGRLSDIIGRRRAYLGAIILFLVGSVAATFATDIYQLTVCRAVQGVGAGGLMALALVIVGDLLPPRKRPRFQSLFYAAFGLSTVFGPVIGGLFADIDTIGGFAGWRLVFLINVPISLATLVVAARWLHTDRQPSRQRFADWSGVLLLLAGLLPLLVVAQQGRHWGWGSVDAIICYGVGAVFAAGFVVNEHVLGESALLPLKFFHAEGFGLAVIGSVLFGVTLFGTLTIMPQYLQVVRDITPAMAGALAMPAVVGIIAGSVISARAVERTGRYKVFPIIGNALIAIGSATFAQANPDTGLWLPLVASATIGCGLGFAMQALVIAVQAAGGPTGIGVSSSAATFFRSLGGVAGITVAVAVMFTVMPGDIDRAFGGTAPRAFASRFAALQSDTRALHAIPTAIQHPVVTGIAASMSLTFLIAAGVALAAAALQFFLKQRPLGTASGDSR